MKNDSYRKKNNRRGFLKIVSLAVGGSFFNIPLFASVSQDGESLMERVLGEKTPNQGKKLGIALVGLGGYSSKQLAPALQQTENCYLAGIVTGTPDKIPAWKAMYNIPDKNVYNYENFDQIADNKDIDIIYVVLPNSMHADFTIRAAKAGKHVICEKPMATSVKDAERMVEACRENGVQLGIGYRLHYSPFHQRVMELGQQQVFGEVKEISANFSGNKTNSTPNLWRFDKELSGGGPLMDLGIYCVQGAIYTLGKPPVAVKATFGDITMPSYFYDVEQSVDWEMEFENGVVAKCGTSYVKSKDFLSATAENGWWELGPSYTYEGKKGRTSQGKMSFTNIYEQAVQMDSMAQSFRKNEKPKTPGEMGVRDMKVIEAIYESASQGGKRVELDLAEAELSFD